jgi:dsRNA-specific ribonuclease
VSNLSPGVAALTPEKIATMRRAWVAGATLAAIARAYNIGPTTTERILKGQHAHARAVEAQGVRA